MASSTRSSQLYLPLRWRHLTRVLLTSLIVLAGCTLPEQLTQDDRAVPVPARPAYAAQLMVTEAGIYRVTESELEAAGLGWEMLNATELSLSWQGQPYPFWVEQTDTGFALLFYGEPSESLYTRANIYWLERGSDGPPPAAFSLGNRSVAPQSNAAASVSSTVYSATLQLEENQLYEAQVRDGDQWFWHVLRAPESATITAELDAIAAGDAQLEIAVWSNTEAAVAPDHHLEVMVNGEQVSDEQWDGTGPQTIKTTLPDGLLQAGTNTLELVASGDTEALVDIIHIDRVILTYPRPLIARDGTLLFTSPGGLHTVAGYNTPATLFDITEPLSITYVTTIAPGDSFAGTKDRQYALVGPVGFQQPTAIRPVFPALDLRDTATSADYLVIGPDDLLVAAQPLLDWRVAQGLETLAVPLDQVYDQFSYGLPEPAAIHNLLRYAHSEWATAPRYVLLLGDYTYDPQGYQTAVEANRLPTFPHFTVYGGTTASDILFTLLDEADELPDIALGRIPARTPDQVQEVVQKTLAYEEQLAATEDDLAWRRQVLAIADTQEASFRGDAQRFLDQFSDDYAGTLLYPEGPADNHTAAVQTEINSGALFTAYFGHGSLTQLGRESYLSVADVPQLNTNEHLPIMLHFTCLTGLFTHPEVESLAETLLWQEAGGAVAVLAPTSLTLPRDQSFLSRGLVDAYLNDPQAALGDMLLAAWREVPLDNDSSRDVGRTFLLFGDPALRLHAAQKEID